MSNELKNMLLEVMKEHGIKIPRLAKETGIPKDRIYKWYQEGSNPKADDSILLSSWMAQKQMEKVPREIKNPLFDKTSKEWAVIKLLVNKLAEVYSIVQERPFQDCLDQLNSEIDVILNADKRPLL